jgi:sugar transferase (PEP-CTERM system associated)
MVRLFHVYYPVRTVFLFTGEALVVCACFLLAVLAAFGMQDSYLVLNYEYGFYKILVITGLVLLCSYYADLYAPQQLRSRGETGFRLLAVLGMLSFVLAGFSYAFPNLTIGRGRGVLLIGVLLLTLGLSFWRLTYFWLLRMPLLRERVYVVGSGPRAQELVDAVRNDAHLGMELIGWTRENELDGELAAASKERLLQLGDGVPVDRVILALGDRRGRLPARELLQVRLRGVKIENSSSLLEKLSGRMEIDDLRPSAMIFSEGFRLNPWFLVMRRLVAITFSLGVLLITLPLLPFIALAIKLTSPGPVIFRQERVGRKGKQFRVYKFRTMRQDAEAGSGAVWARPDDPRLTSIGGFLRKTRLDEIPQLWNVVKGDMSFVGPRPERPEFVQWLGEMIPYYDLRHIVRPGITGWAQVRYPYGASLDDSRRKLEYDLYYIKHMSLSLDLVIAFATIKTVLLRRGSR